MTRFTLTIGILALVFLGEVYLFLFTDYNKPVSNDNEPVITPLLFRKCIGPNHRPIFGHFLRQLKMPPRNATWFPFAWYNR